MIWFFWFIALLGFIWSVRVLSVSNRARDTAGPAEPQAASGATFGPWHDHGPNCRCNVCR